MLINEKGNHPGIGVPEPIEIEEALAVMKDPAKKFALLEHSGVLSAREAFSERLNYFKESLKSDSLTSANKDIRHKGLFPRGKTLFNSVVTRLRFGVNIPSILWEKLKKY